MAEANKDIKVPFLDLRDDMPIVSSRVKKPDQLIDKRGPKRELTQKYQSQPSISNNVEPKTMSHRSFDKSGRKLYKDDGRKKIKTRSKQLSKSKKYKDKYEMVALSSDRHRQKGAQSFSSNAKTKSTNDTSNNQANTFMSMSSQPGTWNTSQEMMSHSKNTRNSNITSKNVHSMNSGLKQRHTREDYNFTSADLKSQYLTQSVKKDGTPSKRGAKKPPMHRKKEGKRTNRISSSQAIDQILQGVKPNIDPMDLRLPNEESTKFSSKKNGIIAGYAANTNQGIIRTYNEDRVSIILNIVKPKGKEHLTKWPK